MYYDNSGPAFPKPTVLLSNGDFDWGDEGMSLRDYFAAAALTGLIVNPQSTYLECPISTRAYELADAMLERRKP